MNDTYDTIISLLYQAKSPVFLTGAGVSASSGIPTYTSDDGTRDRSTFDPESDSYQKISSEVVDAIKMAEPNDAHYLPGELAFYGADVKVVTQNIDGLYQAAGFSEENLVELHGNLDRGDIVGFGEQLDEQGIFKAQQWILAADLLVIAGTGLWVEPAASLPYLMLSRPDNKIVLINKGGCSLLDSKSLLSKTVYIDNRCCTEVFGKVMEEMR